MSTYSHKVPLKEKLICVEPNCNTIFKTANERNKHLRIVHNLTYEQYVMKNYFNNEYPTCLCGCGTQMKFYDGTFGKWFADYTTNHWPKKDHTEETKQKIKKNTREALYQKFGVYNVMELKFYKDKIKQTKEEKYGNENYNNDVKNKQTKLERYGDENYNNPKQIIKTNIEKYGANSFTASEKGKEQVRKTCNEHYDVDNPMKSNEIKQKIYGTNILRYGYKCNFENPGYRKQFNGKNSEIEKYICQCINGQHKFIYDHKEYDIKVDNDIFEIDGDFYHPLTFDNLTLIQINSILNDYVKVKDIKNSEYNLYKILVSNLPQEITIENLKLNSYNPNFSIKSNEQIIVSKKYFKNYLEKKGDKKLRKYVLLLLKFVRTFQPEFPYPKNDENLNDIINKILKYDLSRLYDSKYNDFLNNSSVIGVQYLKSKFRSYWNSKYSSSKLSPVNAWNDDRIMEKVIEYRIGLNDSNEIFDFCMHQLIRGLSAAKYTISFFKPVLAASIYKKLLGDNENPVVFDPCCGFGGRLLGFKSIYPKGKYIGCEPNIDTYNELQELIKEGNWNDTVKIYNCKIEDFNIDIQYDIMFTSIPYFENEIYSNHVFYNSFEEWSNTFFKKILSYKNSYINLSANLYDELKLTLPTYSYIKSNTIHFNKSDNNKHELIVFNE